MYKKNSKLIFDFHSGNSYYLNHKYIKIVEVSWGFKTKRKAYSVLAGYHPA